jgi:hypothetical protein
MAGAAFSAAPVAADPVADFHPGKTGRSIQCGGPGGSGASYPGPQKRARHG